MPDDVRPFWADRLADVTLAALLAAGAWWLLGVLLPRIGGGPLTATLVTVALMVVLAAAWCAIMRYPRGRWPWQTPPVRVSVSLRMSWRILPPDPSPWQPWLDLGRPVFGLIWHRRPERDRELAGAR